MTLPPALSAAIGERIGGTVTNARPLYGGDISLAARFQVGGADYFVKWGNDAPPAMFPAEAHGLSLLAKPGVIRVPAVIAQGDANGPYPAFLVLEWIDTTSKHGDDPGTMERFGQALAALHRQTASTHGLDRDNFIGRLPQPNAQNPSWIAFYRDQRIGFQVALAQRNGRLPKHRADLLNRLMERLPNLLEDVPPSLLHGDLWGGNYLIDTQGDAVLIDPAVHYGHCEMDIAMSELFGGFSARFYNAYNAAWPLDGYTERRPLYQLYYILVHLNLFGEHYGSQVDSIAAHYVG